MKLPNLLFIAALIIFTFCWQLFFIYGFDFFWEDFNIFGFNVDDTSFYQSLHEQYAPQYENMLPPPQLAWEIVKHYGKDFFKVKRLFQIGFHIVYEDRPYMHITYALMRILFGKELILYKLFKILLFVFNASLLFFIIKRISLFSAIGGVLLYISSPNIWLTTVYVSQLGLLAQAGTLISLFLFINLTEGEKNIFSLIYHYTFIALFSNFAALISGDGRYLAILFFSFIVFFRKKNIYQHLPFLIILLFMQIPVLGYFKKLFYDINFQPINITSHPGTPASTWETMRLAALNYKFPLRAIGQFFAAGIILSFLLNVYLHIRQKTPPEETKANEKSNFTKESIFIFGLWFLATLFMTARARGYHYGMDIGFQLFDLLYIIPPIILLGTYYYNYVGKKLTLPYRKYFFRIVTVLIIGQFVLNMVWLNRFRGRWGNHFGSWQNAKKYIEEKSDNAYVSAYTTMCYEPFLFSNKKIILSTTQKNFGRTVICDLSSIREKFEEGFEDVFVLRTRLVEFTGEKEGVKLVTEEILNGDTGDLYDRLKKLIGRPPTSLVHVYHFKPNSSQQIP